MYADDLVDPRPIGWVFYLNNKLKTNKKNKNWNPISLIMYANDNSHHLQSSYIGGGALSC